MSSGFGLPTRLLATSSPSIPSFENFSFQSIGKQPGLLARLTDSNKVEDDAEDESMSISSDNSQQQQNAETSTTPQSQSLLWLVEKDADTANVTGQTCFPVAETSTSHGLANGKLVSHQDIPNSSSPLPTSHTVSQLPLPLLPNAAHQISDDSCTLMELDPSSASLGAMPAEDIQPLCAAVSPTSIRNERLRQILSGLKKITLLSDQKPNLASAILLTSSAQQKADAAYVKARLFHRNTQELLQSAQKAHAEASALLKDVEEVKGLADGAKAEIERISSVTTDQRIQSDHNEIRDLLQLLENHITEQEAGETVLRVQEAQQLKTDQQKKNLAASTQPTAQPSSPFPQNASVPSPVMPTTPQISIPASQKQPLFYSPTSDIDVKDDPRICSQPSLHPSPALASSGFCQKPQAKHLLHERSLLALSSLDAAHKQQNRIEGGRQTVLEEDSRKHPEEGVRREGHDKRKEDLCRTDEHEQKQEEERRKHEKMKIRTLEEDARKVREESEILHEKNTPVCKEVEKKKACEFLGAMERIRADVDRNKTLEESERRIGESQGQRKTQKQELVNREEVRVKVQGELGQRSAQEEARKICLALQQHQRQRQRHQGGELQHEPRSAQEDIREEKLRHVQTIRRAQIQAEKDKTMADRTRHILDQRLHETSKLTVNLSSVVSNDLPASPLALSAHLIQHPSSGAHAGGSTIPNQASTALNQQASMSVPLPGSTSDSRALSLPPVAFLPQSEPSPSAASHILPSRQTPTLSVYSSSSDSGNVPYLESKLHSSSVQVQAANIRHIVNALNIQPPVLVKIEPAHDDFKLLYPPSRERTPAQRQRSQESIQEPATEPSENQQSAAPPTSQPPLLAESTGNSHIHGIVDHRTFSSPVITEIPCSRPQVPQRSQAPQKVYPTTHPIPGLPRTQGQPISAIKAQPQPSHPVSTNEARREVNLPSGPQISGRSRLSTSPFRMGPDIYVAPQNTTGLSLSDTPSDMPTEPVPFRGQRSLPTCVPPVLWDHYSPPPKRPRSPLAAMSQPRSPPHRQIDTYRPNYSERARSPPNLAGRKRSRESSPGPHKRDYRDYDVRRAPPVRKSRTPPPPPPPRGDQPPPRRTPSRSRSSSPGSASYRPSLATRLGQGPPPPNDTTAVAAAAAAAAATAATTTHRIPTAPLRDRERDREPHLLSRFSDTRLDARLVGRARGKRGRGGNRGHGRGGGGGGAANSHASLEERISPWLDTC